MPGVQKPHCEPWKSTIACCTGCSVLALGEVLDGEQLGAVDLPEQQDAGVDGLVGQRARRAAGDSTTVQAPQSPSAQPSLVPVAPASSRSQSSSKRSGRKPFSATVLPRKRKDISERAVMGLL